MIGLREIFGLFTGAKRNLLFAAGALAFGGMAWNDGGKAPQPANPQVGHAMGDSLRADWSERTPKGEAWWGSKSAWGDGATRLGLSFIAAMIFGSVLRVAVKTAISLALLGGVVIWLLQSQGMVDPFWNDYYGSVSESRHWLMGRVGLVGQVLQTHLPSASAALVGFGFGLRR